MMLMSFLLMSDLGWLFSESYFLPSDNFQEFPADLAMTFIETLEVRSNICDDFCGLILFYKIKSS